MSGRQDPSRQAVQLEHLALLAPLPFSGREMEQIAALYGRTATVLEQRRATEQALLAADLSQVTMLHFATHGVIDEERPDRSALILTPADAADDGVLQVREIYRLQLSQALVTLSACETALGANVRGEGVIGLSRAFFYAGANAVVASLWSVSDESTADLMTAMYRALRDGDSTRAALRRAKLEMLDGGGTFADPYFWAAFIVIGNGAWRTAPPPADEIPWAVLDAFFAFAIAVIAFVIWRRRARRSASR